MSFDPIIALNNHIAILTMIQAARRDVETARGMQLIMTKGLGRLLVAELDRSRKTMASNKMFVQEKGDRRYSYAFNGQRAEYEIQQTELDLHISMVLGGIGQALAE